MGVRGAPIPFSVNGKKFQVVLGDAQVAAIEQRLDVNLNDAFNMLGRGFMSASTVIIEATVKIETELGFVPIQLSQIAEVMKPVPTGMLDADGNEVFDLPLAKALGEAQVALGNALGFAEASLPPSESGSALASPSKTSSSKKTGQS